MIRTFKALGLALFAILAVGAFLASAAQAQGVFTNLEATELTVTQDEGVSQQTGWQQFTTTSGSVQCKGIHAETKGLTPKSTLPAVTAENIVATECTGPFGEEAKVEFNECDYQLTAETTLGATGMEITGKVHVNCPTGKQITVTGLGGFCQIHIAAQKPGGHVIAKTITGTPNHVTLEATVTGIAYQGTGLCSSSGATPDGKYIGNVTVKGFKKTPHEAAQQTPIEVH